MTTPPHLHHITVEDTLNRWPATARVFLAHRMACVGCTMAPFERLPEAAGHYGLPEDAFLDEIHRASLGPEPDEPRRADPDPSTR